MSTAEYISLGVSIFGVPGLAVGNAKMIGKLACWSVKAINTTSSAIALLHSEQKDLCDAVLQNQAAIDYLLMSHHVGCALFKDMCCFNLTNNYNSIEARIHTLQDLVHEINQSTFGDGWWS